MGLGSRLSPWNLGLSSSQAATCNSSTQQRHASALLNHKKKSQVLKTLKDTETLGLSPCHIPNQQPTTNNHNVSEAPAAKQRKVTSNVRPVWPSKCGVWRPTSSGSSVGPTARGVVSPGICGCFAWSWLGQAYWVANPNIPNSDWLWFQVDVVKTVVRLFYWSSHEVLMPTFLKKLKHRLAFPILLTFSEMDRWAIWLP